MNINVDGRSEPLFIPASWADTPELVAMLCGDLSGIEVLPVLGGPSIPLSRWLAGERCCNKELFEPDGRNHN